MPYVFEVDTGSTLLTSLMSYWKLDEASGTRVDVIGSHNLTEGSGTVNSATGIKGSAADFETSASPAEWLLVSDHADLSTGDIDFSIAVWVQLESKGSRRGIVAKGDFNSGTQQEYQIHYNPNNDRFEFIVSSNGIAQTTVVASTLGSPSTGVWYFIVAWHDATADTINIQVNNGTADSTAFSSGLTDQAHAFVVGAYNSSGTFRHDGLIDELGFWKKVLSTQEKTDLYNSGAGNTLVQVNLQTITADTTILEGQFSQTVNADSTVILQPSQTITSDTSINGTSSQLIVSDVTILTGQSAQTITADSEIFGVAYTQTITADSSVMLQVQQTISSDVSIKKVGIVQAIGADTTIFIQPQQTIQSNTIITINEAELKLFKEADFINEVGIAGNPLDFGIVEAGDAELHADNPFVLFNDKGGTLNSVDAKAITARVVQLDLVDELVGTSNGTASQSFTVAFPPVVDDSELIIVKVNNIAWARVTTFAGQQPSSQVYTFNATTGTVTFGDGLQGAIPTSGHTVKVSYTPDTVSYGKETAEQLWISVKSNGIISNPITVDLEEVTPDDTTHVTVSRTPLVSVEGVFLLTDPNGLGTNYFTGGTFDSNTGSITLGTALPDTEPVWVAYTYTIGDDLEGTFSAIGKTVTHTFENNIPSNNGKKISFRINPPATASPSSPGSIRFKVRFEYQE